LKNWCYYHVVCLGTEHTFDGQQDDLEIQFVHTTSEPDYTVIGVLCDVVPDADMSGPALDFWMSLKDIGMNGGTAMVNPVDFLGSLSTDAYLCFFFE